MFINVVIVILIIVAVILFATWQAFRNFVLNIVANILSIMANFVRRYSIAALWVLGIITFLVLVGLFFNNPIVKGLSFGLAALLVYLIWLPAGIILRIFRVNNEVFPKSIRAFAAWLCFIGFLGVISPEIVSDFKLMLIAILAAGVFAASTIKVNILERLVFPLVIVMCLWVAWGYFFPEDFRSTNRYFVSWAKLKNTVFDRGSIGNETEAASTYARIVSTVNNVYTISSDSTVEEYTLTVPKDSIVRVVNHTNEVMVIDQVAYIQVQLKNDHGSFFNGPKVYVQAEHLEIGGRTTIDPSFRENQTSQNSVNGRVGSGTMDDPLIISGLRNFDLAGGEYSPWFGSPNGVKRGISMWSPNQDFKIHCSDGTSYPGIETIPAKKKGTCYRVEANSSQVITIMVY